jgi:outer membrane protein assembly factor BamD (BamD/ComL family)
MNAEEVLLKRFYAARDAWLAGGARNGEITDDFEQTARRRDLRRQFDEARAALKAFQTTAA